MDRPLMTDSVEGRAIANRIHSVMKASENAGIIDDYILNSPNGTVDDYRLAAWGQGGTDIALRGDDILTFIAGIELALRLSR